MNVYNNEKDRETYLKLYFTERGIKVMEERLIALAQEYVKELKYPVVVKMLGFVGFKINSKAHHEGMMENLRQILGKKNVTIEVDDGN